MHRDGRWRWRWQRQAAPAHGHGATRPGSMQHACMCACTLSRYGTCAHRCAFACARMECCRRPAPALRAACSCAAGHGGHAQQAICASAHDAVAPRHTQILLCTHARMRVGAGEYLHAAFTACHVSMSPTRGPLCGCRARWMRCLRRCRRLAQSCTSSATRAAPAPALRMPIRTRRLPPRWRRLPL